LNVAILFNLAHIRIKKSAWQKLDGSVKRPISALRFAQKNLNVLNVHRPKLARFEFGAFYEAIEAIFHRPATNETVK
jgi:hypothetical protein